MRITYALGVCLILPEADIEYLLIGATDQHDSRRDGSDVSDDRVQLVHVQEILLTNTVADFLRKKSSCNPYLED